MHQNILHISYLVASVLFIVGLKMLSHPESARKGNVLAAIGMAVAIVATLTRESIHNEWLIIAGIAVGSVIGTLSAKRVKMTAMPQMVSFFNGMGGGCAALIGINEYTELSANTALMSGHGLTIVLGLIIGSVSFSGSMIAMGKLQGAISDALARFKGIGLLGILCFAATLGLGAMLLLLEEKSILLMYILFGVALLYGILFVLPIGGADMPVVISLLNSFTGIAAACGGFMYGNQVMLTGGILVGAAGTILTFEMCKAMNRPLGNVLFGVLKGSGAGGPGSDAEGAIKEVTSTDAGILLSYAKRVVIIPGYGLAVAQAQHICHEMDKLLEEKGVEVKYAIHPVAGRMPGHMNVLLAEADVPYSKLYEMEEINQELPNTDVAVIIGANDVVNPAAKNDPSSSIYGMPILDVTQTKNVIVLKRSMGKGYAGIENELFYADNTKMLFGDAKSSIENLVTEIKEN